jgi:hypothetical protein
MRNSATVNDVVCIYAVYQLCGVLVVGRVYWVDMISPVLLLVGAAWVALRYGAHYPTTVSCVAGAALGQSAQTFFTHEQAFIYTRSVGFPFVSGAVADGAVPVLDMHAASSPWITVNVVALLANTASWAATAGVVGRVLCSALLARTQCSSTTEKVDGLRSKPCYAIKPYCYVLCALGAASWLRWVLGTLS